MGAGAVLIGVVVLFVGRNTLQGHLHIAGSQEDDSDAEEEAELLAVSELD
jgi:hypothetical protein